MAVSATAGPQTRNVTLAWDARTTPEVTGYRIYWGTNSGQYSSAFDAGSVTSVTISNLAVGNTYYFAASAYDSLGLETALSEEIVYDMPPGDPDLQIAFNAQRQVTLTAANVAQGSFRILATSDLVQWSPLATVMTDSNGTIRFTDTTAGVVPVSRRFYRLEKVAP